MKDVKELLKELTLEEKALLCSGQDYWYTKEVKRLDIPKILTSDGPHGLRVQRGNSDHLGINESENSTCFPTACTTASSFDIELLYEMGKAIAEEANDFGVNVVLGPGVNIKRHPLCGRNFEYFSEDPFLSGELATSFIKGVQDQGVGTCIKHFCANNQEKARNVNNSIVDERALREIYLPSFEKAVKEAKPWSIMSSYNLVNGEAVTESKKLLTEISRKEWGYDGVVITDWGAINNKVNSIKAGNDLEMPYLGCENDKAILNAIKDGTLSIEELDKAVERILTLISKAQHKEKEIITYHHDKAVEIAEKSAILLKNDDDILPIKENAKLAIIGSFAKNPRYQGAGSSKINPVKIDIPLDELNNMGFITQYAEGYAIEEQIPNDDKIKEAVGIAKDADYAIVFAGLPQSFEGEGKDRDNLEMPESHVKTIKEVSKVNKNTIVVLMCGSPTELLFIDDVKAILLMYLSGEGGGKAVANLLSGKANPSGKLAETWPEKLTDIASNDFFSKDVFTTEYRESIFVGYRWFDTANIKPLYPFGYGLSYTKFNLNKVEISSKRKELNKEIKLRISVENIGNTSGAEVVQVYVRKKDSKIFRADKELKGFSKIYLEKSEAKEVEISLNDRSFSFYDTNTNSWQIEKGEYEILVGTSSKDIAYTFEVEAEGIEIKESIIPPCYKNLTNFTQEDFKLLFKDKFPLIKRKPLPYTMNSIVAELNGYVGKEDY